MYEITVWSFGYHFEGNIIVQKVFHEDRFENYTLLLVSYIYVVFLPFP